MSPNGEVFWYVHVSQHPCGLLVGVIGPSMTSEGFNQLSNDPSRYEVTVRCTMRSSHRRRMSTYSLRRWSHSSLPIRSGLVRSTYLYFSGSQTVVQRCSYVPQSFRAVQLPVIMVADRQHTTTIQNRVLRCRIQSAARRRRGGRNRANSGSKRRPHLRQAVSLSPASGEFSAPQWGQTIIRGPSCAALIVPGWACGRQVDRRFWANLGDQAAVANKEDGAI